jgi:hypothetical protein
MIPQTVIQKIGTSRIGVPKTFPGKRILSEDTAHGCFKFPKTYDSKTFFAKNIPKHSKKPMEAQ